MSRYLAPQSYHCKTLLQFGRGNNKTCIILCKSRFIFYIGCFSVIVYLKNPIRIFFKRKIETCDGYLHLITSRCIENEEDATNGHISRQRRIICIPALIKFTLFYTDCLFIAELKHATRIQK